MNRQKIQKYFFHRKKLSVLKKKLEKLEKCKKKIKLLEKEEFEIYMQIYISLNLLKFTKISYNFLEKGLKTLFNIKK